MWRFLVYQIHRFLINVFWLVHGSVWRTRNPYWHMFMCILKCIVYLYWPHFGHMRRESTRWYDCTVGLARVRRMPVACRFVRVSFVCVYVMNRSMSEQPLTLRVWYRLWHGMWHTHVMFILYIYVFSSAQVFGTTELPEKPIMLPPFVDSTHCLPYHLTRKGRAVADRVVTVLAYACPDITYSPTLYPITALLLHFMSGEFRVVFFPSCVCLSCGSLLPNVKRMGVFFVDPTMLRVSFVQTIFVGLCPTLALLSCFVVVVVSHTAPHQPNRTQINVYAFRLAWTEIAAVVLKCVC